MILVWEWAVRILMALYNYSRIEAIDQIKTQDWEAIVNNEVLPPY